MIRAFPLILIAVLAYNILVFGGGVIPEEDVPKLQAMGAGAIFGPGTSTSVCIDWLNAAVQDKWAKENA